MPDYPLGALVQKLQTAIHDLTAQLEAGSIPVGDWQTGMQELLARYHTAAYMIGLDSTALSKNALDWLLKNGLTHLLRKVHLLCQKLFRIHGLLHMEQ
jgi:hypothetical protein